MSLPALYQLASEYRATADELANLDLPEEVVRDTLEGMSGDLEVKAQNVVAFAKSLEAHALAIKEAEGEMEKRRKAIEARAERMRAYVLENMQRAGISKINCPWFCLSVQNNPPAVVIDSEGLIPAEFMRQPEAPPPAPDKTAIKSAIQAGQEVAGAHLKTTQRLVIK